MTSRPFDSPSLDGVGRVLYAPAVPGGCDSVLRPAGRGGGQAARPTGHVASHRPLGLQAQVRLANLLHLPHLRGLSLDLHPAAG